MSWLSSNETSGDDAALVGLILIGWLFLIAVSYALSTLTVLFLSVLSLARTRFGLPTALWWAQAFIGVAVIGVICALPFVFLGPLLLPSMATSEILSEPLRLALTILAGAAAGIVLIPIMGLVTRFFAWLDQKALDGKARRIAAGDVDTPFVLLLRPFKADNQLSAQTDSAFRLGAGFRRLSSIIAVFLLRFSSAAIRMIFPKRKDEEERPLSADSVLENLIEKAVRGASKFHPFDTEVAIANAVRKFGPLVAVGRPKALFGGAGRVEVDDSEWQRLVADLAARARAIVFLPGYGDGTYWEIANVATQHAAKTVFVMLPNIEMSSVGEVQSEPSEEGSIFDYQKRKRSAAFDPGDWVDAMRAARKIGLELPEEYNLRGGAFYLSEEGWRRQGAFSVLFPGAVTQCCRRVLAKGGTSVGGSLQKAHPPDGVSAAASSPHA